MSYEGDRTVRLLEEILHELKRIQRMLEPKFTLHIQQTGEDMAAITAGQSGSFFLTATSSDNSTVVLSNPTLLADDSTVTVAPDTTDPSGLTFTVSVLASDIQTSFNLSATADATSNTQPMAQSLSASLSVTISPASVPTTFTLTINEK